MLSIASSSAACVVSFVVLAIIPAVVLAEYPAGFLFWVSERARRAQFRVPHPFRPLLAGSHQPSTAGWIEETSPRPRLSP